MLRLSGHPDCDITALSLLKNNLKYRLAERESATRKLSCDSRLREGFMDAACGKGEVPKAPPSESLSGLLPGPRAALDPLHSRIQQVARKSSVTHHYHCSQQMGVHPVWIYLLGMLDLWEPKVCMVALHA